MKIRCFSCVNEGWIRKDMILALRDIEDLAIIHGLNPLKVQRRHGSQGLGFYYGRTCIAVAKILSGELRSDVTGASTEHPVLVLKNGAGMDWLVFVFALECGLLPNTGFAMYQPDLKSVSGADGFYTDLSASVESFGFYVGGGMRNYFWKKLGKGFRPYQMTFLFNAGWRNDFLDIGFRHYCMHPVVPFLALTGAPLCEWEGAYDELFIRVHGRLTLIKGKEDREVKERR